MYHLPEGYNQRLDNDPWDDTSQEDEWQKEVYLLARDICKKEGFKTVCDLGCGSGFKLVNYLGEFDTIGIEVPATVEFLKSKYPDRRWVDDDTLVPPYADMLICADVLEHVPNPDSIMGFIRDAHPLKIILSTPERDIRNEPTLGPPGHTCHCREWNMAEFKAYVEDWFKVETGPYIFGPQNVQQLVVCTLK
jgi:hypothetical protein